MFRNLDAEQKRLKLTNAQMAEILCISRVTYERIYLRRLNERAIVTGLVKVHPDNPTLQRSLPISGEISRHAASLTNITDKLVKHLAVEQEDDDEGLGDYE